MGVRSTPLNQELPDGGEGNCEANCAAASPTMAPAAVYTPARHPSERTACSSVLVLDAVVIIDLAVLCRTFLHRGVRLARRLDAIRRVWIGGASIGVVVGAHAFLPGQQCHLPTVAQGA